MQLASLSFVVNCCTLGFFTCGSIKTPAFVFASETSRKKFCKYSNAFEFLSIDLTNCLMRPNFKCNGGVNILLWSVEESHLTLLFPKENSVCFGRVYL